jgi:hypothetical protein
MLRRLRLPLVLLAAGLLLGGCAEGGPLLSGIEGFINKEGLAGQDLPMEGRRWRESEKEKPKVLKGETTAFADREKRQMTDLAGEWRMYKTSEAELTPDFGAIAEKAARDPVARAFPKAEKY